MVLVGVLIVVALILVHVQLPLNSLNSLNSLFSRSDSLQGIEGFSSAAVNPVLMPECVTRSTDAQSLLARISNKGTSGDSAELRLLVSKLCCMEADIAAPSAGVYRTMNLQFRTSEDTEPASTIVGRCLRGAVNKRDIEIIVEKFRDRGHVLVDQLCVGEDKVKGHAELDAVVARLNFAMMSFCLGTQPSMDRPIGARDMGFWEPEEVSELSQYQGISSTPKSR